MEKNEISLSIVIPAYNEEEGIAGVVSDLDRAVRSTGLKYELIVVNDGSSDRTAELAAAAGARVISHPANAGYGASLLTGFAAAANSHIVMIDADGSYKAEDLAKLLPFARDFDMVIGARSGIHYWGNSLKYPARLMFLWLAEYVTGQDVPDANSGFRIIRKEALACGPILCWGFSFSTTLTLMFLSSARFVKFVPIDYVVRKGSSKIRIVRDTLRASQVLVESIVYYNPLKLVLPLCLVPVLCAAAFLFSGSFGWAAVSLFAAIIIFVLGTILDLIRLKRR